MNRAEFQAVQYKYRLYEAKRDGTPNEWSPSREVYVKHGNKEKLLINSFSVFICKLFNLEKACYKSKLKQKSRLRFIDINSDHCIKIYFPCINKNS